MNQKLLVFKIEDQAVFGINEFDSPFRVEDQLIDEARVVHIVSGNSRLYAANQYLDLESGDTLIMRPDNFVNNWKINLSKQRNKVVVFNLTPPLIAKIYSNSKPHWLNIQSGEEQTLLKADSHVLLNSFFENLILYTEHFEYLEEHYLLQKTSELLNILVKTDSNGSIQNLLANLFVQKNHDFQQIIQQNLFSDLTIENLAFLSNLSLSSFKRKFNNVYGTSPNKYIVSKRLEKAQFMLLTTSLTISKIAFECGFNDLSYFTKTFKKHYNMLPSELRTSV